MSNFEESLIEKEIRNMSNDLNPYAQECKNRHLWSEGFRQGAKIKTKNFKGSEITISQKAWAVVRLFEENKMFNAAKILRDNL